MSDDIISRILTTQQLFNFENAREGDFVTFPSSLDALPDARWRTCGRVVKRIADDHIAVALDDSDVVLQLKFGEKECKSFDMPRMTECNETGQSRILTRNDSGEVCFVVNVQNREASIYDASGTIVSILQFKSVDILKNSVLLKTEKRRVLVSDAIYKVDKNTNQKLKTLFDPSVESLTSQIQRKISLL